VTPDPTHETEDVVRSAGRPWPLVVVALFALLWSGAWVRHFYSSDYRAIATSIQDDSYYYLLPAWNVSRLGWFTFDGVTQTYGFQPLWELVLSALGSVMYSREQFLRLVLAISALLYAGAAVMTGLAARAVWRSRRPSGGSAALMTAAAAMLLNPEFSVANLTGKENALYGAVFSALVFFSLSGRPALELTGKYARGCLAGAALLARLTPTSMVAATLSYLPLARRDARRLLPGNIAAAVLVMLPWLIYATWAFGSVMPMSGRVKMEGFWPTLRTDPEGLSQYYHATVGYTHAVVRFAFGFNSPLSSIGPSSGAIERNCFALMAVIGAGWILWSRHLNLLLLSAGLLAATAAIPLLLHQQIDNIYYFTWYIVEVPIVAAILVGVGVEFLLEWVQRYSPTLRVCAATALVAVSLTAVPGEMSLAAPQPQYVDHGQWQDVMLKAGDWINREVHEPPGTRIGAFSAGMLGWFSKYTVINLDGLANDEVAVDRQTGGDYASYCRRVGITIYADAEPPSKIFARYTTLQIFDMPAIRENPHFYVVTLPSK
jgi:hypothetical protein